MVATKTRRAEPTEHAQAAKQIRAALKAAYPRIKFSVTSKSYSGGSSVHVDWTDGPTSNAVDALITKHEYGRFDGMRDLYEYTNVRHDIPQVKFAIPHRSMSHDSLAALIEQMNARYGYHLRLDERGDWIDRASDQHIGCGWASQEVNRTFHDLSLVCPACGAPTLPGDRFCPACGAPTLPGDRFCPDCGASLPAEDR